MATLNTMLMQYDGYSTLFDKINKKTNEVSTKILNASGSTDKFNAKLNATEKSSSTASVGLGKLFSKVVNLEAVQKGMGIVDEYTNTGVRLGLITSNLQEQEELQNKIFAAANRSRGTYGELASSISKMGITAGEAFGSNDELVAFTELIQKSVKLGGASQIDQSSVMNQLTQGMATGNLQGDDFDSIIEKAPMIADAVATYTGKSKDEIKEMSSEGLITSDIIKNAMFMSCDSINDKFKDMPMTFADVWNIIKNGGLQVFSAVIDKVNELTKTDGFMQLINGIIIGFQIMEQMASWCIDAIISNWDTIVPVLGLIGSVLMAGIIAKLVLTIPLLQANALSWLAMAAPVLLVIGVIGLAIWAARQFGVSWEQIFGFVGGVVGVFATYCYNLFVKSWNIVAAFINFFGNVFTHPIESVKTLFCDLALSVIGYIGSMAQGIEDIINKIPGVDIDITGGLDSFKSQLETESANIKSEAGLVEYVKTKDFMDYSEGYTKGSNMGSKLFNNMGSTLSDLTNKLNNIGPSEFDTSNNPITVEGTGSGGKVDVDMGDEDLQYLRDIAERDYINQFSTASLAPNVQFTFGDVHEEADANKVAGRIQKILAEEIAMVAEGAY